MTKRWVNSQKNGTGNDGSSKPGQGRQAEHKAGAVKNDDQLQHQRGTPDDPDKAPDQGFQRGEPAHGAEADHQTQRQGEHQRQQEDLQRFPEACQQLQSNREEHTITSLVLNSLA